MGRATLNLARFPRSVRTQLARLADGEFLAGATNLCVFGHPGTGKTHVVSALGHELVRQGYPVLFTPVSSLVERILQAKRELRLGRELSKLDRIACLTTGRNRLRAARPGRGRPQPYAQKTIRRPVIGGSGCIRG